MSKKSDKKKSNQHWVDFSQHRKKKIRRDSRIGYEYNASIEAKINEINGINVPNKIHENESILPMITPGYENNCLIKKAEEEKQELEKKVYQKNFQEALKKVESPKTIPLVWEIYIPKIILFNPNLDPKKYQNYFVDEKGNFTDSRERIDLLLSLDNLLEGLGMFEFYTFNNISKNSPAENAFYDHLEEENYKKVLVEDTKIKLNLLKIVYAEMVAEPEIYKFDNYDDVVNSLFNTINSKENVKKLPVDLKKSPRFAIVGAGNLDLLSFFYSKKNNFEIINEDLQNLITEFDKYNKPNDNLSNSKFLVELSKAKIYNDSINNIFKEVEFRDYVTDNVLKRKPATRRTFNFPRNFIPKQNVAYFEQRKRTSQVRRIS